MGISCCFLVYAVLAASLMNNVSSAKSKKKKNIERAHARSIFLSPWQG